MARRYNFKALDQRTGRLERACTLLEDGEKARLKTKEPDPKHPQSMPLTIGLDRAQIIKGTTGARRAEDQSFTFRVGATASFDLNSSRSVPVLVLASGGCRISYTPG